MKRMKIYILLHHITIQFFDARKGSTKKIHHKKPHSYKLFLPLQLRVNFSTSHASSIETRCKKSLSKIFDPTLSQCGIRGREGELLKNTTKTGIL